MKSSLLQPGPAGAAQDGLGQASGGEKRPLDNLDGEQDIFTDLQLGKRRRVRPGDGIQVTRFRVWQDLSSNADDDLAPLHVSVALAMSSTWHRGLSMQEGAIRIERLPGKEVIQGVIVLHHAYHGLDHAQNDSSKVLQFVASPPFLHSKLGDDEKVRGVIKMKFWNRKLIIKLPETRVLFIR